MHVLFAGGVTLAVKQQGLGISMKSRLTVYAVTAWTAMKSSDIKGTPSSPRIQAMNIQPGNHILPPQYIYTTSRTASPRKMQFSTILLFPLLALTSPAPVSPAPQGPLMALQPRSENACCKPFGQGSRVCVQRTSFIRLTGSLNHRAGVFVAIGRWAHPVAGMESAIYFAVLARVDAV
ncbi:hypothetical protein MGYG_07272 [Nannizzia gypsea CBS 118893]|uniref:Uncharacterized protein n=1 Tax=Arthroderma gypseum (strain ATCC MYA-4604 / CBS 118893) TaxID=535722 RepID=E4V2J8_ARTGP|nr:hypothetical protein MGYG_07272 [Nannizzia gypsea CBS 118893]EFR04263.1 hypothetical protein MGYG_07272 [Nannizzia gypsea CBS 118893]